MDEMIHCCGRSLGKRKENAIAIAKTVDFLNFK
jgi:hypothetical protein